MRRILAPLIGFFGLAGLADSVYLVLQHFGVLVSPPALVASTCELGDGSCVVAARSNVGSIAGIPAPVFGSLYFAAILAMVIVRIRTGRWVLPYASLGFFAAGLAYSGYLLYLMVAVLDQPCPYCLAAHSINVAIFVLFSLSLHLDTAARASR